MKPKKRVIVQHVDTRHPNEISWTSLWDFVITKFPANTNPKKNSLIFFILLQIIL
jgi:hypothetical protein